MINMTLEEKMQYGESLTVEDVEKEIERVNDEWEYKAELQDRDELCGFCHLEGKDFAIDLFNGLPIWQRVWAAIAGWDGAVE